MSNNSKRREHDAALRDAVEEAERHLYQVKLHKQRRVERKAAVAEAKAAPEWLRVKEIAARVVKKQGAEFDDDKRYKIEITVCDRIVSDSADGKIGTEQSPALMLLSEEYDKAELKPSDLEILQTSFDRVYGDERRQKIAEFLIAHGWMKRSVATQWVGPEIPLPRHIRLAGESNSKTRMAEGTECLNWLKSEMEASEERSKKFGDFFEEAKNKYKVTARTFRTLWDRAIDETGRYKWRKAGRPRKSQHGA
jgi:hypothetical protein